MIRRDKRLVARGPVFGPLVLAGAMLVCLLGGADLVLGQPSFEVLHAFAETPMVAGPLVEGTDGLLYGLAAGGAFGRGAVIALRRQADGTFAQTVLHSFSGPDGFVSIPPRSGLIQAADGNFYGTTGGGGAHGLGIVFKMTATGALTTLHSFKGPDGAGPQGGLIQGRDGDFYGTTAFTLDRFAPGTIFKVSRAGVFTLLHTFHPSEGSSPQGPLVQAADGSLYGTTDRGGPGNLGTIFKITPAGAFTVLHSFSGSGPYAPSPRLLLASDGNLYGTASVQGFGQETRPGAAFRITPAGDLTFLHTFTLEEGGSGSLLLEATDGSLYGVNDDGVFQVARQVFRMDRQGVVSTVRRFPAGLDPSSLIQARDGRLYGTTFGGRAGGASVISRGLVFGLTLAGELTALRLFIDEGPLYPTAPLVQASDGSFYGSTCMGGLFNVGAIFRMTPAGAITVVHSFSFLDGTCPAGGLTVVRDGRFYGTTFSGGGPSNLGTVFRMDSAGMVTTLHTFSGPDGGRPLSALVQGPDGSFYGTSGGFADVNPGSVFKVTSAGELTVLHRFSGLDDGRNPFGGLVWASDGNFYGTTAPGGSTLTAGTVFRLSPTGDLTTLHVFTGADGQPAGKLVEGSDGNLYGLARSADRGLIFRISKAGMLTVVHRFSASEGANPRAGLVLARDGNFYGTTAGSPNGYAGDSGLGSVFRMTPAGELTVLHAFAGGDGANSSAPLLQGRDGALYGTALNGGLGQRGVVFRITP